MLLKTIADSIRKVPTGHRAARFMALLLCVAAALFLTGCMVSMEYPEEESAAVIKETSSEEGNIKKAETTALSFLQAVVNQKYDGTAAMVFLPEGSIITDDDIAYCISQGKYADLTGNASISDFALTGSTTEKTVSFKAGKASYQLSLKLGTDNLWKVVLDDLYVENWSVKAPGKCTLMLDGLDAESYRKVSSNTDSAYTTYTFPAVSARKHELVAKSPLYGTFSQSVTPKATSDTYTMVCSLSEQETGNILNCIRTIWNGLYDDYRTGADVPAIKKYFSSGFDTNGMTDILRTHFPKLEGGKKKTYSDFIMTEITAWNTDNYGAATLQNDDAVAVTFGYRIEFVDEEGEYHNCNKVTNIVMIYEGGTYKIKSVPDTDLFSDNDYEKNDF